MTLTASQTLITVLAVALGCMITRFAPFVIFPDSKEPPEVVTWLGKVLPAAMMGLLVVYSLKGVSLVSPPHGIPEFLAILVIVLLHRWKHNSLLSIAAGAMIFIVVEELIPESQSGDHGHAATYGFLLGFWLMALLGVLGG